MGLLLGQLRDERGLSIAEVAEQLLCSPAKVSRLEAGLRVASSRDIRDLCLLYGVTDKTERQRLLTLARESRQPKWWEQYDLLDTTFVGLEAEATSTGYYGQIPIVGLFQIEIHARAISGVEQPSLDPLTVAQRIAAQIKRSNPLTQDLKAASLIAAVEEAASRRPVDGPAIMRAQLAWLSENASRSGVTLQVVPFEVGTHPGWDSNFTLLQCAFPMAGDVFIEGTLGDIYLESSTDRKKCKRVFYRLQSIALDPGESIAMVEKLAATYQNSLDLVKGF